MGYCGRTRMFVFLSLLHLQQQQISKIRITTAATPPPIMAIIIQLMGVFVGVSVGAAVGAGVGG